MRNCSGSASSASFTSASVNAVEHLVLGAAAGVGRLEPAEAAVEVEVLDVVEVDLARAGASWPGRC